MLAEMNELVVIKGIEKGIRRLRKQIKQGIVDFQFRKVYETAITMGELQIAVLKEGKNSQNAKIKRDEFYKGIERLKNDSTLLQNSRLEEEANKMLKAAEESGVLEE